MNLKGTLPTLILAVLEAGPSHGYAISKDLQQRSNGQLDFGAGSLYPALHAQEKKGLIASFETTENGRTRRYYELTEDGRKTLAKEREEWQRMTIVVGDILGAT